MSKERIGELLVRENLISPTQLKQARDRSRRDGSRLGYELTRMGFVEEGDLTSFLSRHFGVPSVNISGVDIAAEVINLIPSKVARRHQCIPINRSGATLVVAMADPSNIYAIDDLKFMTGYKIEPVVASESAIEEALYKYYESEAEAAGPDFNYDDILDEMRGRTAGDD